MSCAIRGGNYEIVRIIFDRLQNFTYSNLVDAFTWYDENLVNFILENSNFDEKSINSAKDEARYTLIDQMYENPKWFAKLHI